ncbi:MAG: amidohydrolase family protein [Phycisphaerales bacterium]
MAESNVLRKLACVLIACLAVCTMSFTTVAQDDPPAESDAAEKPADDADEKAEEKDDATKPEADRYLAITGGTVHTISGGRLDGATILCKNGRILEIGARVTIPSGAEVIDATGYEVYPGLIALRSAGIVGGGSPDDSTDVYALNMSVALAAGITTAVTGNDAAKLTWGTLDDMMVGRGLFEDISYPTSNPAARRELRADLDRVRQHLRDVAAYEEAKRTDSSAAAPDDKWLRGKYEKYLRLMKRQSTAIVDADLAAEMLDITQLTDEYGIRLVIRGAIEAWTIAPQLARAGVSAIVTPRVRVDEDDRINRPNGSSIENAAILARHGIKVGFIPVGGMFGPGYQISFGGLAGRDLLHLPMAAAFAVRGGMSNDDAIRALTLDAARILGLDARIGSIDIGKDADFVITDGHLLHYMTHARWTIVNGRVSYDKSTDSLFGHIRPDGEVTQEGPVDDWPRRLGAPW